MCINSFTHSFNHLLNPLIPGIQVYGGLLEPVWAKIERQNTQGMTFQIKSKKTKHYIMYPPIKRNLKGWSQKSQSSPVSQKNTSTRRCASFKRSDLCRRKASPHCGNRFFARESGWPGIYANDWVVHAEKECEEKKIGFPLFHWPPPSFYLVPLTEEKIKSLFATSVFSLQHVRLDGAAASPNDAPAPHPLSSVSSWPNYESMFDWLWYNNLDSMSRDSLEKENRRSDIEKEGMSGCTRSLPIHSSVCACVWLCVSVRVHVCVCGPMMIVVEWSVKSCN